MIRWNYTVLVLVSALSIGCQGTLSRKPTVSTFKIGERATVGGLTYSVYETQYLPQIGEGADVRIPKDRFLIVHLSVMNAGGANANKPGQSIPTFYLIDDAGQSYTELDNGAGVPQWLGFARKVRPAESTTGNIVFDVPPKHFNLKIADELEEDYALVDIPLTFGETAPRVDTSVPTAPQH